MAAAAELVNSLIKVSPQQNQGQELMGSNQISQSDQNLLNYSHLENLIEESKHQQNNQNMNHSNNNNNSNNGSGDTTSNENNDNNNFQNMQKEQSHIEVQVEDEKDAKSKFKLNDLLYKYIKFNLI